MAVRYNQFPINLNNVHYIFDGGNKRSYPGFGELVYNLNTLNAYKTTMNVLPGSYVNKGVGSYFNLSNNLLEIRAAQGQEFIGRHTVSLWIYPEDINNLQVIYQLLGRFDTFTGTAIYISGGYIGAENHNNTPDGEEIGYTVWYQRIEPNKWYNITLVGPDIVSSTRGDLYVNGLSSLKVGGGGGAGAGGERNIANLGGGTPTSRVYNFLTREQVVLSEAFNFRGRFSKFTYISTNNLTSKDIIDIYNRDKGRYKNE